MIKRLFSTLLLLLFISPLAWSATVTATVDKNEIIFGETINLTITSDGTDAPDLAPLKNLFDIINMQQSQEMFITNGKTTSSRTWVFSLMPKAQSKGIVIPPITLGKDQTQPITIKIIDSPTSLTVQGHDILKIETTLSEESPYIQQQVILTLRIYVSNAHVHSLDKLFPPTVPEANLTPINDAQYSRNINGTPYTIVEKRYALSPQKSGTLRIPSFALTGVVNENGHRLKKTVTSNQLNIHVKPKPASYPANAPWLPASHLTVEEHWNKDPANVQQGNSLTRTLKITATGLTSNQITPQLDIMATGIKTYPEKPTSADTLQDGIPVGIREENIVIVPIQTGQITIPEVKIAWWNTKTDKLEYATVPEQKITVTPNPNFTATNITASSNMAPAIIKRIESPTLWIWQLCTSIFAVTTLIFFTLWLYARKQPAIIRQEPPVINPKTLLDDIKKACLTNDPQATRIALDNWVKQQPENLTELLARYSPLAETVEALNRVLYSEVETDWQGESLWQAIQTIPPKEEATVANTILPPLYPK